MKAVGRSGGGLDPVVHDGVVEEAPDRRAPAQDGQQDAEDRKTLGEVPGAVHRVHDHGRLGLAHAGAEARVGGDAFLAQHLGLGPGGADGGGDRRLGLGVREGHEVGGADLVEMSAGDRPRKRGMMRVRAASRTAWRRRRRCAGVIGPAMARAEGAAGRSMEAPMTIARGGVDDGRRVAISVGIPSGKRAAREAAHPQAMRLLHGSHAE
jgi:hypothetical protein